MSTIITTKRRNGDTYEVIVDSKGYGMLKDIGNGVSLQVDKNGFIYAVTTIYLGGKQVRLFLHRLFTNCPKGMVVDHINHNTLDNRLENLRIVTKKENCRNRKDKAKLYSFNKSKQKWEVKVMINRECYYIGQYNDKKEAQAEAQELRKYIYGA